MDQPQTLDGKGPGGFETYCSMINARTAYALDNFRVTTVTGPPTGSILSEHFIFEQWAAYSKQLSGDDKTRSWSERRKQLHVADALIRSLCGSLIYCVPTVLLIHARGRRNLSLPALQGCGPSPGRWFKFKAAAAYNSGDQRPLVTTTPNPQPFVHHPSLSDPRAPAPQAYSRT
jgi:hypothetical protein